MAKRWRYIGDVDLPEGGVFIQESGYSDHVYAVQVTPCSAAGGPDNVFWIESGTVYLGNERTLKGALECCDLQPGAPLWEQGYAVLNYAGMDSDICRTVQIGREESEPGSGWGGTGAPDYVLRGNASLRRFVRREFLRG